MDKRADVGALVGTIYEAGLDTTRWTDFMESLGACLHAGFGTLWVHDFGGAGPQAAGPDIQATSGLDAGTLGQYHGHHAANNVWVPNTRRLQEGCVTVSSALFPDGLLKDTEFYNDFLHPQDLFYAVGTAIVKNGPRDVKMGFLRSKRAGAYTPGELRLVRQLMPHLRNAVSLHRQLHRLNALADSAVAALELVPVGVILLTESGRRLHANRRADELVARTQALHFGPTGTLQAAGTGATACLQRLIDGAVQTGARKSLAAGGALQLVGAGGRRLQVLVTPLPALSTALEGKAMAAVFCSDPDALIGRLSQRLEALYRMTPAEAQLTEALVNGQSLQEYALARHVAMNTLRTQLKSATAKTGTRRQADLVRITGPAIFHPAA